MNKIDERIVELINEFNGSIETKGDTKDIDSSVFIDFYLNNLKEIHNG